MKDVKWAIEEIEGLERGASSRHLGSDPLSDGGDRVFYHGQLWGYAKALDVLRKVEAGDAKAERASGRAAWSHHEAATYELSGFYWPTEGWEREACGGRKRFRRFTERIFPDGRMERKYGPWEDDS